MPYTEKLVENLIRDYPLDLLGESLVFDRQQPVVEGFRPDLIFEDAQGRTVIVEVQVNALDRYHLYKCLEYRDLLLQIDKFNQVRVILFCNELPNRYSKLLETHQIEIIQVSKGEVIKKAHFHLTDVEVIESLTPKTLLRLLAQKRTEPIGSMTGLVVFWTFPLYSLPHEVKDLGNVKLHELVKEREFYFADSKLGARKNIDGHETAVYVPNEIFLPNTLLDELDHERVVVHELWLELFSIYFRGYSEDPVKQLTLGWRGQYDVYDFKSYAEGNIKKFIPVWERYGSKTGIGYDLDLIARDLHELKKLLFWGGKYPNLKPVRLFDAIEIKSGPGGLAKNTEIIESNREYRRRFQGEEAVVRFDQFVQKNEQRWATISVRSSNYAAIEIALSFMTHLRKQSLQQEDHETGDESTLWTLLGTVTFDRGHKPKCVEPFVTVL